MIDEQELGVVCKALTDGLVEVNQFTEIVRQLHQQTRFSTNGESGTSLGELLASRAGLTPAQIEALVSTAAAAATQSNREPVANRSAGDMPTISQAPARPDDSGSCDRRRSAMQLTSSPPADAEDHKALRAEMVYRLSKQLGRGGLGLVNQARDQYLGRDVAVKQLRTRHGGSSEHVARFVREAELTGQLEHPNIAPVYGLGVDADGQPFYAMKLIQGRTLSELIRQHYADERQAARDGGREASEKGQGASAAEDPRQSAGTTGFSGSDHSAWLHAMVRCLIDTANAVAFAHSRDVIHRDVKPSNIMVGDFGETLLVDWGLAKAILSDAAGQPHNGEDESTVSVSASSFAASDNFFEQTATAAVLGTPVYMSPEQASGAIASVDQRSDVFLVGATLYHVLAGQAPYASFGVTDQIVEAARMGRFPPPRSHQRQTPKALEAICLKAMSLEPSDRYQSAGELSEELSRWQAGLPVDAYPEPWWVRTGRWVRRHRTLCASVAAVVMVALMLGAAWRMHHLRRVERVATGAESLIRDGQAALMRGRLQQADADLRQATAVLANEPDLRRLHDRAAWWVQQTSDARKEQADARRRFEQFKKLRDDAIFHAVLATGADADLNAQKAQQLSRRALALFSLDPLKPGRPLASPKHFTPDEIDAIAADCDLVRCALADALAQPSEKRSLEEDRAAARGALDLLRQTELRDHSPKAYHLRMARYLQLAGDHASAYTEIRRASDSPSRSAADAYAQGDYHYRQQDFSAAAECFRRVLKHDPGHFWAQYYLGASLAHQQQWSEAVISLTAAANLRDDFPHLFMLRGFALGELGQLEEATADFERADRLGLARHNVLLSRGVMNLRHGKLGKAVKELEQAVEAEPDATAPRYALAEAYRITRRSADALEVLNEIERRLPASPHVHLRRAEVLLESEQLDAALAELDTGLTKADRGSISHETLTVERGRVLQCLAAAQSEPSRRQAIIEKAIAAYERVLTDRPDHLDALWLRGIALAELQRDAEAIQSLDAYLAAGPLMLPIDITLPVQEHLALGEPRHALTRDIADRRRALAVAYRERGLAHNRLGHSAEAVADFLQAEKLAAGLERVLLNYDRRHFAAMYSRCGWALLKAGTELAMRQFDQHIELAPHDPEPYTGRGHARALRGDWRAAVTDADKAVELSASKESQNPGLYFNAAGIYAECAALAAADPRADDQDNTTEQLRQKALDALRQCIERFPEQRPFYREQFQRDPAFDSIRNWEPVKKLITVHEADRG